jgi:hypothetical protein
MGGSESARPTLKIEGGAPAAFISTANTIIVILKWPPREQSRRKTSMDSEFQVTEKQRARSVVL